jgi:cell division protein ZapA
VEKVDTAMCKIRDAGKVKARDRIAVLAALNLAFDVADRAVAPRTGAAARPLPISGNGHAAANGGEAADPRLGNLLLRLDRALGDDGRLL